MSKKVVLTEDVVRKIVAEVLDNVINNNDANPVQSAPASTPTNVATTQPFVKNTNSRINYIIQNIDAAENKINNGFLRIINNPTVDSTSWFGIPKEKLGYFNTALQNLESAKRILMNITNGQV